MNGIMKGRGEESEEEKMERRDGWKKERIKRIIADRNDKRKDGREKNIDWKERKKVREKQEIGEGGRREQKEWDIHH